MKEETHKIKSRYTLIIDDSIYKENICSCGSKQGGWSEEEAENALRPL